MKEESQDKKQSRENLEPQCVAKRSLMLWHATPSSTATSSICLWH
jgi:hypothetical protein